tara:strand:- start:117 stop:428 length:312 start_codon:yes stop_codon:yes gene_type:complete
MPVLRSTAPINLWLGGFNRSRATSLNNRFFEFVFGFCPGFLASSDNLEQSLCVLTVFSGLFTIFVTPVIPNLALDNQERLVVLQPNVLLHIQRSRDVRLRATR